MKVYLQKNYPIGEIRKARTEPKKVTLENINELKEYPAEFLQATKLILKSKFMDLKNYIIVITESFNFIMEIRFRNLKGQTIGQWSHSFIVCLMSEVSGLEKPTFAVDLKLAHAIKNANLPELIPNLIKRYWQETEKEAEKTIIEARKEGRI